MVEFHNRRVYIWLIFLIIIAIYVRVHGADIYHYYVDELMHIQIAMAGSLKQMLQFSLYETHPPLGHIIRYFWQKISDEPWFARSLSLLFGIAVIPVYYAIGKKLNGELAGLCAAALAAFSHGMIIQSYVVRNYSIFLFFLSICFYFYLLWRDDRANNRLLKGYSVFALLACLTHFSAIFALFSIAAYELAVMLHQQCAKKHRMTWIALNCVLGLLFIGAYCIWNSSIDPVHSIVKSKMASLTALDLFLLGLLYPTHLLSYIYPDSYFLFLLILLAPFAFAQKDRTLQQMLVLTGCALALAIILFVTEIYPFAGDRHGLWLLPFFVVSASCIIANAIRYFSTHVSIFRRVQSGNLYAAAVCIGILAFYNPDDRFSDSLEYKITEKQWQEMLEYLQSLGSKDLLVSGRTDAIMFSPPGVSIYSYLGNSSASISDMAAIIPYYHTHLLFNNRYIMRIYENSTLINMMQEAEAKGKLAGYDRLVFVSAYLLSSPMARLITCKALDKTITSFPDTTPDHIFSTAEIPDYQAIFVTVNKQDFFSEIVAPEGKAHSCL